MGFELEAFDDPDLNEPYLNWLLDSEAPDAEQRLGRLWAYFRNEAHPALGLVADALNANSRPYVQAQEAGLPPRITGLAGGERAPDVSRKEVVIENDIAWRVQTMVEYLFGRPVALTSRAADPQRARAIEAVVAALLEGSGGLALCQEMALLGSVYGFVDVVLRTPADWPGGAGADGGEAGLERALSAARRLTLEAIEAPRVLPLLDGEDYRRTRAWVQRYRRALPSVGPDLPWVSFGWAGRRDRPPQQVEVVEILSDTWWQRYEDRRLVAEGPNPLGALPVVHVQNLALPGDYEGLSDVEPLIPLQDELNTRLSDRASRVTHQSFKMYLGKGIEDFLDRPVGPGQMWTTSNLQAGIEEFGHDAGSPSEDAHIDQIRQALDKVSGVTPLAAGLVRDHVGTLTSATALRVVLSGLLARTQRKRLTYGAGLRQVVRLSLTLLDRAGLFPTSPDEREFEVHWPGLLEEDAGQQLANARTKLELGVPRRRVLHELGYDAASLEDEAHA